MSDTFDPYYTWLGIPPQEQPPDYYRLLGIRRFENNPEVIANALGQRQVHLRSYESGERAAAAERVLRELAQAGECLASADKKGAYDRELRQKDAPKLGRASDTPQISRPAALHKSNPNITVAVTQTTVAAPAPSSAPSLPAPSATMPWQPLAISAAAVAGILVVGIAALVAGLFASGLFMKRPADDLVIPNKPLASKLPELKPFPTPGQPSTPGVVASDPPSEDKPSPAEKPVDSTPIGFPPPLAPIQANVGPPLDLLKDFEVKQIERGEAHRNPDGSWQTGGKDLDILMFPVASLPPEYVVDTTVTRLTDYLHAYAGQGLVTPGGQCLVNIGGSATGTTLTEIEGALGGSSQDRGEYPGTLLPINKRVNLKFFVFKDRLAVECDGKTVLNWTGGMHRLSLPAQFHVKDHRALFFFAWKGRFVLSQFDVRPLGVLGAAPPEAIAANVRPVPVPEPTPPVPLGPGDKAPLPVPDPDPEPTPQETRLAVPSEAAWQEKLKLIREIYKPGAKPAEKAGMAERLVQDAEGESHPTAIYALLVEARRLKMEAGDIHGAFAVCDALTARFALDPWQVQLETLKQAPKWADSPLEKKALAEITRRIAEGALAAAQFTTARDAAELAEKLGDIKLKNDARDWKESAERSLELETAYVSNLQRLKAQPDDVEANAICGRFLCLVKRDWALGLPHLAKSNHAAVKKAAALDLASPATSDQQLALGDEWWQLADSLPAGREADSLRLRARHWYELGLPGATGLARGQTAKRIDETYILAGEDVATSGAAVEVLPDPRSLYAYRGKTGKVFYFDVVGNSRGGGLYGTNTYTDDSSLAKAAVHAGVLKDGQAGVVKVTILAGRPSYTSSTRNGITSSDWGAYPHSYKVELGPRVNLHRPSDPKKTKAAGGKPGTKGSVPGGKKS